MAVELKLDKGMAYYSTWDEHGKNRTRLLHEWDEGAVLACDVLAW